MQGKQQLYQETDLNTLVGKSLLESIETKQSSIPLFLLRMISANMGILISPFLLIRNSGGKPCISQTEEKKDRLLWEVKGYAPILHTSLCTDTIICTTADIFIMLCQLHTCSYTLCTFKIEINSLRATNLVYPVTGCMKPLEPEDHGCCDPQGSGCHVPSGSEEDGRSNPQHSGVWETPEPEDHCWGDTLTLEEQGNPQGWRFTVTLWFQGFPHTHGAVDHL